jgi:hypothetical protein
MAEGLDTAAVIEALGPAPRSFPPEVTKTLPRIKNKLAAALGVIAFGAVMVVVALIQAGDSFSWEFERGKILAAGFGGLFMVGFGAWLLLMRARIRATCIDVLANGRATIGRVESLQSQQIQGTLTDHYQFGYNDALGAKHVLKAFWNSPSMRVERGGEVVILHDTQDPRRAAVVPLDYPALRLVQRDSADDMITTLERLGVPLDFGQSSPSAALLGGVVKAGLYHGVRKIEAGAYDEAIESLTSVLSTAERDEAFARVKAAVYAQRGLAHEKKGDAAGARTDYEAALELDSGRQDAASGLDRLGRN